MNKERQTDLKFLRIDPPERKRIYVFPSGQVIFENVVEICVRPSGTHRLVTADGKKHIVSIGWLSITLEVDEWTF